MDWQKFFNDYREGEGEETYRRRVVDYLREVVDQMDAGALAALTIEWKPHPRNGEVEVTFVVNDPARALLKRAKAQ